MTCLADRQRICRCQSEKAGAPHWADTLADLVSLIRKIRCSCETFLVMDNYQLVGSDIPRQMISAFSAHGNERLHIIVITQQLKGGSEATVHYATIHTIDSNLIFDKESIGRYFRMAGISLSNSELDGIHKNTEGRIAAIRLQMLNYQQTGAFEHTSNIE